MENILFSWIPIVTILIKDVSPPGKKLKVQILNPFIHE